MLEGKEAKSNHTFVVPAIYASILCIFYLAYGVFPGPEVIFLCFFIYAAYNKWSRRFVGDWFPFVASFLSYDAINGLAGSMSRIVHVEEPISAELRVFGTIPTLLLQQFYRTPRFGLSRSPILFPALHSSNRFWVHIVEVSAQRLLEVRSCFCNLHLQRLGNLFDLSGCASVVWC